MYSHYVGYYNIRVSYLLQHNVDPMDRVELNRGTPPPCTPGPWGMEGSSTKIYNNK